MTNILARHRWFDQWLGAGHPRLRQLVNETKTLVEQHELSTEMRQRRRRTIDQAHHETAIETVVANLAYAVRMPPETGRLAISARNGIKGRTRYENPALGKPLRRLIWRLGELGLLEQQCSTTRGEASSIAPTPAFRADVERLGVALSDFGRLEQEEVILLTQNSRCRNGNHSTISRVMVDYVDTPCTEAMRGTMRGLNRFLTDAPIAFEDDGLEPVDPHRRVLRRHFVLNADDCTQLFNKSGRLFGGFWMNLASHRRRHLRIENEPVTVLDYSSMFTRLAYARIGVTPPEGDLYSIPGLERHRDVVKRAMNCFLFDDFRRSKWPREWVHPDERGEVLMPEGWTVARTREAILRRHPVLQSSFSSGLGFAFMHTESEILVEVLEELRHRGVVALGLHDGLMVAHSRVEKARMIMEEVARQMTSAYLPVTIKACATM